MEPVGITNAWTRVVVPKSSSRTVTVHSAIAPRSCFAFFTTVFAGASVTLGSLTNFIVQAFL